MIEETVLNYMKGELDVPVMLMYPEIPSEDYPVKPERFVVLEKVGAARTNHANTASIAFKSYGPSILAAAALDEEVRETVEKMTEISEVAGVRMTSNYNFTDTRAHQPRYQCVWDIYYV